jgi:hypothetical protein
LLIPEIFKTSTVFSLTAWNPMGQQASEHDNHKANWALKADIEQLLLASASTSAAAATASWSSFGFSSDENNHGGNGGWREEGFSLAFAPEAADAGGREAVLELGQRYRQGAVYEYRYESDELIRDVLPCSEEMAATASERKVMRRLETPPDSPLARP